MHSYTQVACNLLDTGKDVGIGISLEDTGVYMARDSIDPVTNSVCICDLDYLDIDVHFRERADNGGGGGTETQMNDDSTLSSPFLDVCANCNLVRVRTCADSIQLLQSLIQTLAPLPSSSRSSREGSEEPEVPEAVMQKDNDDGEGEDSVVPEMAEAMMELERRDREEEEMAASMRAAREGGVDGAMGGGAQLFFFPDEGTKLPVSRPMASAPNYEGEQASRPLRKEESSGDDSLEDFCILDDEVGTGILSSTGEATVRQVEDENLFFRENFYPAPEKSINYLKPPKGFPDFQSRITLKRLSLLWQVFGGHDFSADKSLPVDTRKDVLGLSVATEATKHQARSAAAQKTRQIRQTAKTRGGPGRNEDQLLEIYVNKVQFQHETYPGGCREASRQVLIIPSFEVRDRHYLSNINKLLHLYSSRTLPRQTNANMLSIKSVQIRPDLRQPDVIETSVSVSNMPLRLNIDQDTLFFIVDFISSLVSPESRGPRRSLMAPTPRAASPATSGQTVRYNQGMVAIEVQEEKEEEETMPPPKSPVFNEKEDDFNSTTKPKSTRRKRKEPEVFFRSFTFSPDMPIRIDYSAKYVDLTQGALTGLLAGMASLNGSELTLKRASYRSGILGFERLMMQLVNHWLADIRQNQIPSLLGGVGPMFSVRQLFQGIFDLVLLPLEQYQKDGRLMKGLQKGANSFTSSTAMSFLDFTNHLLGVIKFMAEMAFDIMSPEGVVVQGQLPHPSVRRSGVYRHQGKALASPNKPADLREGVFNALAVVREGFDETARTLTEAATSEHARRGGLTGAVGGVLRQVPSTMMRPVIIGTTATVNVLEGVQSQVAPEIRREEEEKWRRGSSVTPEEAEEATESGGEPERG